MTHEEQLPYILSDCFFAVGQALASRRGVDYDAVVWMRDRYREKFWQALTVSGNSWEDDRPRVTAVSRWLGQRAEGYAAGKPTIDRVSASQAAAEIEAGCRMSARAVRDHPTAR
jgi:hypothetical protein